MPLVHCQKWAITNALVRNDSTEAETELNYSITSSRWCNLLQYLQEHTLHLCFETLASLWRVAFQPNTISWIFVISCYAILMSHLKKRDRHQYRNQRQRMGNERDINLHQSSINSWRKNKSTFNLPDYGCHKWFTDSDWNQLIFGIRRENQRFRTEYWKIRDQKWWA